MTIRNVLSATVLAALVAASNGPLAAQDGRLSLAERVARLEQAQQQPQQPGGNGASLEMLNRIQELQSELQTLRNLLEQQRFEIDELKQRQRDQYTDLDDRIRALSGQAPGERSSLDLRPSDATAVPAPIPAAPSDPNQLQMQPAAPVDPYTGEPIRSVPSPTGPSAGIPPARGVDPAVEYQAAFDALKQGRYDESAGLFNAFLRNNPDHELADNAQYWLGESYYVTQNYETALQTFRGMTERYPAGEKTADAELKIGYCLYELGQYDQAQAALEGVIQRYPDSTVARLAESRLRALAIEQR